MTIFRKSATIPAFQDSQTTILLPLTLPIIGNKLTLNGTLADPTTGQVSFIANGYSSCVSIYTQNDARGVTFTITGTYNGSIIVEDILGNNNAASNTNNLFDTIISITVSGLGAGVTIYIGSSYRVAVNMYDNNSNSGLTHPNYNYSVLINSLSMVAATWDANGCVIYGTNKNAPSFLTVNNLRYTTSRPNNYYALLDPAVAITKAQLNRGFITQTNYPFSSLLVYLHDVVSTPTFVEITQS